MNAVTSQFTLVAIVLRVMVLCFAALAVPRCAKAIDYSVGPLRPGLRAIPYGWAPWELDKGRRGEPRPAEGPEVPILCPRSHSEWHARDKDWGRGWNEGPLFTFMGLDLAVRKASCPTSPCFISFTLGGEFVSGPEALCTYALDDGTYLLVSTAGRHLRIGSENGSYVRTDPYSSCELLGMHFIKHPIAGTFALSVLVLGAWLVFRRWKVSRWSFVGLAVAAFWLVPLGSFLASYR